MLAPEVWNFAPPASSFSHKKCKSIKEVLASVKNQYFNHFVSVTLPNTLQVPQDMVKVIMDDNQFYKISRVSLIDLFNKDFIDLFVKKGQLTAISIGKCSEEEDCVAFIPNGRMILSLNRKTYQELGIDGSCTNFGKKSKRKNIVVLDLASDSCKFREKLTKIQETFPTSLQLHFDLVLSWEPEGGKVCPSSIAYYFSKKGYAVKECDVNFKQRHEYNVTVPVYNEETEPDVFTEWLGSFSLQCELFSDSFISTFTQPDHHEVFGQAVHLSFTGLLTNNRIQKLISQINEYIIAKEPSSWISLVIQGFDHSIIVQNEKFYQQARDHHHVFVFKANSPTLVCSFFQA